MVSEVDGLEGQEELCFVNANGTWYKKEPNFQYNNYQQKPFYNNQQGGYQARENYSQGFSSKGNQSTQGQAGSSTSAPQESSTDAMLKQILESQTRISEVDGLEGQEELCFVNANGTWYKKEPNFQYNNYQQKPLYNNQQGCYQARENYSQGFSSKGNQSTQGQVGSSTSAPQESSTDAMLK
ncbi:hypothetical protein F2Q69_00010858 [Brassica cretica]|uniref:Uncharacterized protein n=1 Tax=Brassica cretica TaxID=69181 RepID=A0A8S9R407_BRACR|nr:hypothetical protein F2Q69_00010858 [Brassica cretica]